MKRLINKVAREFIKKHGADLAIGVGEKAKEELGDKKKAKKELKSPEKTKK